MILAMAWYSALIYSLYKEFKFKTYLISIFIYALCAVILSILLASIRVSLGISSDVAMFFSFLFIIMIFIILIYRARYYQYERREMIEEVKSFIEDLNIAPFYLKIFYFPLVLK
jgi:hypothetical protein